MESTYIHSLLAGALSQAPEISPRNLISEVNSRSIRRDAGQGYGDLIIDLVGDLPVWVATMSHEKLTYHVEQSVKVRRHFMHELCKACYGSHYDRRGEGLLSFWSIEFQRRGTVHQHGIIAGENLLSQRRSDWKYFLQNDARGKIQRLDLPRDYKASIRYCAKYAAKGGEVDIWLPRRLVFQRELVSGGAVTRECHADPWCSRRDALAV